MWVEVPKTIYVDSKYNKNGTPSASSDWEKIEKCLKEYTSDYADKEGAGDKNTIYTTLYRNMLKSVYENGGFWIGRYEAGSQNEKAYKISHVAIADDEKAVTKPNMYPYNYLTRNEAQTLATKMGYENCTSSLLFGVQWDLTLKYIETKIKTTDSKIKTKLLTNCTELGNYVTSAITLKRGKFTKLSIYECD